MRCFHEDFIEGATFHIYNHAIDDYDLFYDDEDYDYFLSIFKDNLNKVPSSVYAYCLMPNHYHFLIRQDSEIELYRLFNYSFVTYAHYFNNKHDRKGSIFSSKLQHVNVKTEQHILQLCKYIHLNPVRKDLVTHPEEWPYSDYRDWISNEHLNLDEKNNILKTLPGKYESFVESCFNFLTYREYRKMLTAL